MSSGIDYQLPENQLKMLSRTGKGTNNLYLAFSKKATDSNSSKLTEGQKLSG